MVVAAAEVVVAAAAAVVDAVEVAEAADNHLSQTDKRTDDKL